MKHPYDPVPQGISGENTLSPGTSREKRRGRGCEPAHGAKEKLNKSQKPGWGNALLSHGLASRSMGINHSHWQRPESKGNWPRNAIV